MAHVDAQVVFEAERSIVVVENVELLQIGAGDKVGERQRGPGAGGAAIGCGGEFVEVREEGGHERAVLGSGGAQMPAALAGGSLVHDDPVGLAGNERG